MYLELLVPNGRYPYRGDIHYRQAGEECPLCGHARRKWRIISLRDWAKKYAKNDFCPKCVEQRFRLEHTVIL